MVSPSKKNPEHGTENAADLHALEMHF